jgi:hypothetical protein
MKIKCKNNNNRIMIIKEIRLCVHTEIHCRNKKEENHRSVRCRNRKKYGQKSMKNYLKKFVYLISRY